MGTIVIALVIGLLGGLVIVLVATQRLRSQTADTVQTAVDTLLAVAGEKLADHREAADQGIDLRHQAMNAELARVADLVAGLQRDHAEQQGRLDQSLRQAVETTTTLNGTTSAFREALASTKARGQWGERMAEDVLGTAGFVEGINYRKQTAIAGGGIPDFTFLLPRDRVMHMDVKFPLDNFMRAQEATTDAERDRFHATFLKDVRSRVKEIGTRRYIDPDETVEAVLLFIPNESIYGFIHENDPQLADLALEQKVVLCSPFTLFAVLAVVRQAVDAFLLERTTDEILTCLSGFETQWQKFSDQLDSVGKRFESTQKAFDELAGPRRRQLQRSLDRVDDLRNRRGLPDATIEDAETFPHLRTVRPA